MIQATEIINSIPNRFRPEKAKGIKLSVCIDLGEKQWTIQIEDEKCFLSEKKDINAETTIECDEETYCGLETGEIQAQMAFLQGKIKVSDVSVFLQFIKCFKKYALTTNSKNVDYQLKPEKIGPLKGVKIIDFTRLLPGPLGTMFLADMGAEVYKIEDPDNPDYIRNFEPFLDGESIYYKSLNKNKKSIAINYLKPEGKEILMKLVKNSDIMVEQFRPGVMDEIGLGYEEVKKWNPKIIYASVSGFGLNNELSKKAGHDLNYIALSGLLDGIGNEENVFIPGFQTADVAGGAYMLMNGILAALYQREKTGKGEYVHISMTHSLLGLNCLQLASIQIEGSRVTRGKTELSGALPNYNVYKCKDNLWVALGSLEPKFWNQFCEIVKKNEWKDILERKDKKLKKVKEEVAELFLTNTREYWLNYFKDQDICLSPVLNTGEVLKNSLFTETGMFTNFKTKEGKSYVVLNQPVNFSSMREQQMWGAPVLGEDTFQVLKENGIHEDDINKLSELQIIRNS